MRKSIAEARDHFRRNALCGEQIGGNRGDDKALELYPRDRAAAAGVFSGVFSGVPPLARGQIALDDGMGPRATGHGNKISICKVFA